MFFQRKPFGSLRAQSMIARYRQEVQKDAQNRSRHFFWLFSALTEHPSPKQIRYIGDEAAGLIRGKDAFFAAGIMRGNYEDTRRIDLDAWKQHCSPEGYRALLAIGSAHANGYLRQACLKRLADMPDVLDFVLLRLNDWVPQIRQTAWELLPEQLANVTSCGGIIRVMPYVEFVRRGKRAQRNAAFSMEKLDAILLDAFMKEPDAVLGSPVTLRRLCYRVFLLHPAPAYREMLLHYIEHEPDGAQRSALVRCCLQHAEEPVPAALLERFMQDKYWRVRMDAYEYRVKAQGVWDGMEKLLTSPYYPIREFAAFYLAKNGFDVRGYCQAHLPETLMALGECGTADDLSLVLKYQQSDPCEALTARIRLGDPDSNDLALEAMRSSNARLAKTAYRLAKNRLFFKSGELVPLIRTETDPALCWRMIRLMRNRIGAELLPVLIRLTRDYAHVGCDIRRTIEDCTLFHVYHGYYRLAVTQAQHDAILAALDYAGQHVPERLAEHIRGFMRIES